MASPHVCEDVLVFNVQGLHVAIEKARVSTATRPGEIDVLQGPQSLKELQETDSQVTLLLTQQAEPVWISQDRTFRQVTT